MRSLDEPLESKNMTLLDMIAADLDIEETVTRNLDTAEIKLKL